MKMKKIGYMEIKSEKLRQLADALDTVHPGQKCKIGVWGNDLNTVDHPDTSYLPVYFQITEESGFIHLS